MLKYLTIGKILDDYLKDQDVWGGGECPGNRYPGFFVLIPQNPEATMEGKDKISKGKVIMNGIFEGTFPFYLSQSERDFSSEIIMSREHI